MVSEGATLDKAIGAGRVNGDFRIACGPLGTRWAGSTMTALRPHQTLGALRTIQAIRAGLSGRTHWARRTGEPLRSHFASRACRPRLPLRAWRSVVTRRPLLECLS